MRIELIRILYFTILIIIRAFFNIYFNYKKMTSKLSNISSKCEYVHKCECESENKENIDNDNITVRCDDAENKNIKNDANEHALNDEWTLWCHNIRNYNWDKESFVNITEGWKINTIERYWALMNQLKFHRHHLYLMKDGIYPMWEDEQNINGGVWSIKIPIKKCTDVWTKLSSLLVIMQLTNDIRDNKYINGISVSPKSSKNMAYIKIWMNTAIISTIEQFCERFNISEFSEIKNFSYFLRIINNDNDVIFLKNERDENGVVGNARRPNNNHTKDKAQYIPIHMTCNNYRNRGNGIASRRFNSSPISH